MNVIILADSLSTELGGIEKCLYDTCLHLYLRGHQITLVYETSGDQLELYEKICTNLVKVKSYKMRAGFWQSIMMVLKYPADRIYSHYYDNFFFGSLLSVLKFVPFYVHLHLPAPVEMGLFKQVKQKFTLAQISQYIAVSEAVREDWSGQLNISKEKISLAYNGIDSNRFIPSSDRVNLRQKWGVNPQDKVLCYVGRLESYKGIEHLLRAFSHLLQFDSTIKLFIAGKSIISGQSYEHKLRQLVDELNLGRHVFFLNHVAQPEEIYQLSDILVVPSLWLEAFGLVVTEAMACEVPVIASRVGGMPEILSGEFSEYLFEAGNENQLVETLKQLLNWRSEDPQLGQRCRKHVLENFDLMQNIDQVENILCANLSSTDIQAQLDSYQAAPVIK